MDSLTQEDLKQRLIYFPDTGDFISTKPKKKYTPVGAIHKSTGYVRCRVKSSLFTAHRLAFLYMNGEFPDEVDHINHIKTDNRWVNLRAVSRLGNSRNQSLSRANTSGFTGVHWDTSKGRWIASIFINKKNKRLGRYKQLSDAVKARIDAECLLNYHPNHGTICPTF